MEQTANITQEGGCPFFLPQTAISEGVKDGLTYMQHEQLTRDFMHDPHAFSVLYDFCEVTINQREQLDDERQAVATSQAVLHGEITSFRAMSEAIRKVLADVRTKAMIEKGDYTEATADARASSTVIHSADVVAGTKLREMTNAQKAKSDSLVESLQDFSRCAALALRQPTPTPAEIEVAEVGFFTGLSELANASVEEGRAGRTSVRIMGYDYELIEGYLALKVDGVTVLFATSKTAMLLQFEKNRGVSQKDKKKSYLPASAQQWEKLLNDLQLVVKYQSKEEPEALTSS